MKKAVAHLKLYDPVLGDLIERYRNPLQFAKEALTIMPYLMASQMERAANAKLLPQH